MKPDGIAYTGRHNDEGLCYALFDSEPISVMEESRGINLDQN
jgi:hypothetical protein